MRKMKKFLALAVASVMVLSMAGCGSKTTSNNEATKAPEATEAPEATQAPDATATPVPTEAADPVADIIPAETVTLNVYSQLANYEGIQVGWFADVILDKFNVKLNIINEGDGVFDTRMESGDLGDIVIFGDDSDQYKRACENGMLFDWEDEDLLATYGTYMSAHMQEALEKNRNITGTLYGFGHDVALDGGDYGDFDYHPDVRYDLYEQLGCPEVKTMEDWIPILKQMKEICPTSDSGQETWGVSLFNDWDGNMVMFVKATATCFFGVDEFQFGFYEPETGNFLDCLADDGYYLRCLKFYNKLYQENLLDPDSMTQGYTGCIEDYQDGTAFMCIFQWMGAASYNTQEHMNEGKQMLPVAAADQDTLVYGLNPKGGNRVWTIGAKTQYPELCMAIIDWLCTPEGNLTQLYGPKDVCWAYQDDGSVDLTELGLLCKTGTNITMPAPYEGYWQDGQPQYNNTTWATNTEIEGGVNGQTYNYQYWPSYLSLPTSTAMESWKTNTGKDSFKQYLSSFDYSILKPSTYARSERSDELDTMWKQVAECIKNGSWEAIYAKDDAEFDAIVAKMQEDAKAYGYDQCVEWSINEAAIKHQGE